MGGASELLPKRQSHSPLVTKQKHYLNTYRTKKAANWLLIRFRGYTISWYWVGLPRVPISTKARASRNFTFSPYPMFGLQLGHTLPPDSLQLIVRHSQRRHREEEEKKISDPTWYKLSNAGPSMQSQSIPESPHTQLDITNRTGSEWLLPKIEVNSKNCCVSDFKTSLITSMVYHTRAK